MGDVTSDLRTVIGFLRSCGYATSAEVVVGAIDEIEVLRRVLRAIAAGDGDARELARGALERVDALVGREAGGG